jgi:hypothetical protein
MSVSLEEGRGDSNVPKCGLRVIPHIGDTMDECNHFAKSSFVGVPAIIPCLEQLVLLNEIRADALRATGLYDDYIALCERAMRQVGMFELHERVFKDLAETAGDDEYGYLVNGLRDAATCERLRVTIESAAMDDYESRFGVRPHKATAVNVRCIHSNEIWQAVAVVGAGRSKVWYRVEFSDGNEYTFLCLDDYDVANSDQFTIIYDIACIADL